MDRRVWWVEGRRREALMEYKCECGRAVPDSVSEIIVKSGGFARCSPSKGGCGRRLDAKSLVLEPVGVSPDPMAMGSITLADARAGFRAELDKGTRCPCCDRFSKRYRRKLNSGMARVLIWLVRETERSGDEWIDVPARAPAWVLRSNESGKMAWWGLVEVRENESDPSRKTTGDRKVTQKGFDFVYGRVTVPARVILYNDACEGFDGEDITIKDALGKKFSYAELMGS